MTSLRSSGLGHALSLEFHSYPFIPFHQAAPSPLLFLEPIRAGREFQERQQGRAEEEKHRGNVLLLDFTQEKFVSERPVTDIPHQQTHRCDNT